MIEFSAKAPTIPIPFHRFLKVVALVEGEDPQTRRLVDHIKAENFEIEVSDRYERDVDEDADVGAYIVLVEGDRRERARALLHAVRAIGFRTPLWALADSHQIADLAVLEGIGEVDGYIYLGQQTPAFYAKQVLASLVQYGMSLLPPFFGGLVAYDADANVTFACPGHQGGQFYRKSPAGQLFFKHFGEGIFRNDLCNADVDLGDLLIHEGAAALAQRRAARVFGADRTYFVLNGTSTSNKVVAGAVLKRGDLVLFDRNNHKSLHQGALVQAGAIPVFLPTARNPFGMIGAVDWDAWDERSLREQIRTNPLVKDAERHKAERPFRLACIQLATYDGTIYNVQKVLEKIGHLCEYVLWDEAWIGYNAFHPLFEGHSPMRIKELGPKMPGLFSTQSVHKQGAGFSQASQIHKRDEHIRDQRRFVGHKRFNESLLIHASTSPFYPLFASLDVNASVHEGKAGEMLWDRCIALGIETRKKLRAFCRHYAKTGKSKQEQWFFDPFVPDVVTIRGSKFTKDVTDMPWEDLPTDVLKREQQCWDFNPTGSWHGYKGHSEGYAMVDPNKLMLLSPGIDRRTGEYLDFGVPATVVTNYLREQRIVPEKCDLNNILFLMTPAEDESKLNTLIAKLVKFKNLWDRDAALSEVLPTLCAAHSARYAGYTLRQVCNEMHDFYRKANIKELQRLCFRASSFPELAMSPEDAYQALVANDVEYVAMDQVKGRISATLALIYPPGIGVIVPGERWDDKAKPMLDYIMAFQESFNRFPGFNYEVQGVFQERSEGRIKFYTYVVSSSASGQQATKGETVADTKKKMSLVQLTFIVAVNMMGSGIIMLPTNMAKVGAISLLSWIVTALGSMAIAYGFAQAGIFNQRAGGMAAYAEDAYGKDGYFMTFFLYFLSLAIGNVAIGISAVGYLAGFFPWLSSTPIATCIGVIGLLWLTTVANFGGPSVTGRIGSITVWGVILPVGLLSFAGWFWFKGDVFSAAWNPQGLSIGAGMGSSISLTLWAFLGMESAAQNSNAVENPKRDVPLACLFGTLGAAVIYILSTTVIQGIVPNADLAASTGPFALAYAHMFNPTIGTIVMGLAVLACLGSLLGWQFTIAQTGKAAADDRMFPALFSKVNAAGAPITGMLVLGVVQTLLALSTISPSLSEQFGVLVNLAVVTNVVPYVIALSALMVMMKKGNAPQGTYRRNAVIALIAMLYSVYALYASGGGAVMGGMIVIGITYVIWGFIAGRFITGTAAAAAQPFRG